MKLYVESSAVVAWFMGEVEGPRVKALLNGVEFVTTSDLTLIGSDRVLIRKVASGETSETEAATRRGYLTAAAAVWTVLQIGKETVGRARRPFPVEPIRSLDAIHLASALALVLRSQRCRFSVWRIARAMLRLGSDSNCSHAESAHSS